MHPTLKKIKKLRKLLASKRVYVSERKRFNALLLFICVIVRTSENNINTTKLFTILTHCWLIWWEIFHHAFRASQNLYCHLLMKVFRKTLQVRNSELTWREAKRQLRKEDRWDLAELLERDEKEKLFNEHIEQLSKKKREKFRYLRIIWSEDSGWIFSSIHLRSISQKLSLRRF